MATNNQDTYTLKKQTNGLWRVSGTWNGQRLRRHFVNEFEAVNFCDEKNAAIAGEEQSVSYHQTRLDPDQLSACEAGVALVAGRWPLGEVFEAGVGAKLAEKKSGDLALLLKEWLLLVESEVGGHRLSELKKCCNKFVRESGAVTTKDFSRQVIRDWLDGNEWAATTKRNNRNALHRFADWLIEKGYFETNPCAGVRVRRGRGQQAMPSILEPEQAAAFMRAVSSAECRRLKGWATLCLFCGLRPAEAVRLKWDEVKFETNEISVFGTKRGAKPRTVKLSPTAIAWLRSVKADDEPTPGHYTRRLFRSAVDKAGIEWDEDILRHSFASYTSAKGTPINELAEQMGNSPGTIYAHYRTPRTAEHVKIFWNILPDPKK